jgi:hypothetical protein
MASIILGVAGSAIGANFGGAFLGLSGAAIGGMIGSTIGSVVDNAIVAALMPGQNATGARLELLRVVSSTEGVVIPRLFGRARIGGNLIWATDFREETRTQRSGGKGGGGRGRVTEYSYFASFAVGICEGSISGIGRVWADGKELDLTGITWRWYPGDESQPADPLIASRMGPADTLAYRGLAYAVFEELPLERFGNRLPQLTFEVFRPLVEPDTVEGLLRAVTMIPGSGEAVYATEPVREISGGLSVSGSYVGGGTDRVVNFNAAADLSDIEASLDRLIAACPGLEMVSLVVSWFGDDLRCGACTLRPGVEVAQKNATPAWSVNGVLRSGAHVVSQIDGRPAYGGTPSDRAVVQAIAAIRARGLRVTFYPFILMDVPPGNTKADPYSAGTATTGQPVFLRGNRRQDRHGRHPGRGLLRDGRHRSIRGVGHAGHLHRHPHGLGPAADDPALCSALRRGGRCRRLPHRHRDARPHPDPLRGLDLSGRAGFHDPGIGCPVHPRTRAADQLCRGLVGVFRAPARRRLG